MAITATNMDEALEAATKLVVKLQQLRNNSTFLVEDPELLPAARALLSLLDVIPETHPITGLWTRVGDMQNVQLANSVGTGLATGSAKVANGVLGSVRAPATSAILNNAGTVTVQNSAGTLISNAGAVAISGGLVTSVRLPSNHAANTSGAKILCTVSGTYTNGYTPTVTNGVVTGIVLS